MAIKISAKALLRRLGRKIGRRASAQAAQEALPQDLMIEPDPDALQAWRALLVRKGRA